MSRHAADTARVADPLVQPDRFAADVLDVVRRRGVHVLLPVSEASLLAILGNDDLIRATIVPFPDGDSFARVCDKALVGRVAGDVPILVPAQRVIDNPSAREQFDPATLRFPVVVKPARSVVEIGAARAKTAVAHARDASSLTAALDALPPTAYPVMIQERIIGPGVGVFLLRWNRKILASFCHRRIREKPPSGGVSVYRESVDPDPVLVQRSTELLTRLDWQGVAMVEFKVDASTGTTFLMEINGRLWGSLQLAIDAGVDFPRLLVDAALGLQPAPVHTYRSGVRSRWFWGDVDHLIARLRYSDERLALPPDAPGRMRALADFVAAFRPADTGEILRIGDLRPALWETIEWLQGR